MKLSILFLFAMPALAQVCQTPVCISAVTFLGGGLNDGTSGGSFTSPPANKLYRVEIHTTGTPDTVEVSTNGGAFGSPISLVAGGALAIGDGVTITFAASTGHNLTDYWLISSTANGSLNQQTVAAPGVGAIALRNAQDKIREIRSVLDYSPGTDSAAQIQAAMDAACAAPAFEPQFGGFGGRFVNMPAPPTGNGYVTSSATLTIHCDNLKLGSLGAMVPLISSANPIIDTNGHSSITFENVFLQCDKTGTIPQVGIHFNSPTTTTGLKFRDGYVLDCGIPPKAGTITGATSGSGTTFTVPTGTAPANGKTVTFGGFTDQTTWALLNGASGVVSSSGSTSFAIAAFNTTGWSTPTTGGSNPIAWADLTTIAGEGIEITGDSIGDEISAIFEVTAEGVKGTGTTDNLWLHDSIMGPGSINSATGWCFDLSGSSGSANILVEHNIPGCTGGAAIIGPSAGFVHYIHNWAEDLPGYYPIINAYSSQTFFSSSEYPEAYGNLCALHGSGANYCFETANFDRGIFHDNTGLGAVLKTWNNTGGSAVVLDGTIDITTTNGASQYVNPNALGIRSLGIWTSYQGIGTDQPRSPLHLNAPYVPYTQATTLATAITSPCPTSISVTSAMGMAQGQIIYLDAEAMAINGAISGTTVPVQCGYNGTTAATHLVNAPINFGAGGLLQVTSPTETAQLAFGLESSFAYAKVRYCATVSTCVPIPLNIDLLTVQDTDPALNTTLSILQKVGGSQADYLLKVMDPTATTLYFGINNTGSGTILENNATPTYLATTTGGIQGEYGASDSLGAVFLGSLTTNPVDLLYDNTLGAYLDSTGFTVVNDAFAPEFIAKGTGTAICFEQASITFNIQCNGVANFQTVNAASGTSNINDLSVGTFYDGGNGAVAGIETDGQLSVTPNGATITGGLTTISASPVLTNNFGGDTSMAGTLLVNGAAAFPGGITGGVTFTAGNIIANATLGTSSVTNLSITGTAGVNGLGAFNIGSTATMSTAGGAVFTQNGTENGTHGQNHGTGDSPTFTNLATSGYAQVAGEILTFTDSVVTGAAGTSRQMDLKTTVSGTPTLRWLIEADAVAESGSNVGSNFEIAAYDDSGSLLGTPFSIARATGVVTIPSLNVTTCTGTGCGGAGVTSLGGKTGVLGVGTSLGFSGSTLQTVGGAYSYTIPTGCSISGGIPTGCTSTSIVIINGLVQ